MEILLPSFLHMFIGACIAYLLYYKNFKLKRERLTILIAGMIAGLIPDFTKYFGIILFHSIWFTPIMGFIVSLPTYFILKPINFIKVWFTMTLTVLFGHIFIDSIDNGVALFYPFMNEEYSFSIINADDYLIVLASLMTSICILVFRNGRKIALVTIIIIGLYISLKLSSKTLLYSQLSDRYEEDNPIISIYPSSSLHWSFIIKSNNFNVSGRSTLFLKTTEERKHFQKMQWNVLKEIKIDGDRYLITEPSAFNRSEHKSLKVFRKNIQGTWETVYGDYKKIAIERYRKELD